MWITFLSLAKLGYTVFVALFLARGGYRAGKSIISYIGATTTNSTTHAVVVFVYFDISDII